jgi:hypothetical protein
MYDGTKTPLERAFEMARSGQFQRMVEIRRALAAEGFSVAQMTGGTLTRQLRHAMVPKLIETGIEGTVS